MTALYDIIKTEISFTVNDMRALANIEKDFAEFSKYSMRGCVMAVDGISKQGNLIKVKFKM